MKKNLTVAVIILIVVLLSLISFIGIYKTTSGAMKNAIPDYNFGSELSGARNFKFVLSTEEETKEVYVDEQGNTHGYKEIETSLDLENAEEFDTAEDAIESNKENKTELPYNTEERVIKANPEDVLNIESYEKSKAIIAKRLENESTTEYNLRLNQDDGSLVVEIENNEDADYLYSVIASKGELLFKDSQNGELLLDNSHVKKASVVGETTSTGGVNVYLHIKFNKEGKEILERVSEKYTSIPSEVEGEDDKILYVTAELDGSTIIKTYFGEKISTGEINLPIAQNVTDEIAYESYLKSANTMASIINTGVTPNAYELEADNYILSNITKSDLRNLSIIVACLVIGISVMLVVKFKANGLMAAITAVGYIALLNLILKISGTIVTVSGLFAMVAGIAINYYIIIKLLNRLQNAKSVKEELLETIKESIFVLIPVIIALVVYTLNNLNVVTSIGQVLFWNMLLIPIYNYIFTKNVLVGKSKK